MREIPAEKHTILVAGAELSYWVAGEGPDLLLCNGLLASEVAFRPLLGHFVDRYRLVWWRYRGLGGVAGGEPAAPERHALDALAILDELRIQRVALVGWSMGVQVALECYRAASERVAALVLVGGGARLPFGPRPEATFPGTRMPALMRGLSRLPGMVQRHGNGLLGFPEALAWVRRLSLVGANSDPELVATLLRDVSRMPAEAWLETAQLLLAHDATDILPSVHVPTLAVAAGRDPFTSRAAVERLVTAPNAEYLVLPAATHFVLLDHADHLHLRMDKFFSEHGYV